MTSRTEGMAEDAGAKGAGDEFGLSPRTVQRRAHASHRCWRVGRAGKTCPHSEAGTGFAHPTRYARLTIAVALAGQSALNCRLSRMPCGTRLRGQGA